MSRAREIADLGSPAASGLSDRNLIANGSCAVSQRGTSGTSTADIYTVDRFAIGHGSPVNAMTFEQSTDTPDNFKNSIKVTAGTGASASTTGYAILRQAIEGQNISHLGFGTSAAKAIILSFHVKSSLTGTFGVSIRNQAGNRAYGGTYTISSANTWEYVTVAIPGDTSGTWPTDTGIGLHLFWDLGAGSNYDIAAGSWTTGTNMFGVESTVKLTETSSATWQMTGAQLEIGASSTPFEHEDFGTTLRKCQRYFAIRENTHGSLDRYFSLLQAYNTTSVFGFIASYPVTMRATPTASQSGSFGAYRKDSANASMATTIGNLSGTSEGWRSDGWGSGSSLTAGDASVVFASAGAKLIADAEL
tara:strand:+ start:183 stop:1265 length:1083 start_codon:yes stop_codon:yes gene_type:complete